MLMASRFLSEKFGRFFSNFIVFSDTSIENILCRHSRPLQVYCCLSPTLLNAIGSPDSFL